MSVVSSVERPKREFCNNIGPKQTFEPLAGSNVRTWPIRPDHPRNPHVAPNLTLA